MWLPSFLRSLKYFVIKVKNFKKEYVLVKQSYAIFKNFTFS